jgi:hypothetical protein
MIRYTGPKHPLEDVNLPSEWFEEVANLAPFTPDLPFLERHETQLLFICDAMQQGMWNEHLVRDFSTSVLGIGFTRDPFVLWKKSLGKYSDAIPLDVDYDPDNVTTPEFRKNYWDKIPGRIRGEIRAVRPYRFMELDIDKQNGLHFQRRRVSILVPYREVGRRTKAGRMETFSEEKFEIVKMWMYVGIPDYFKDIIDLGSQYTPTRLYKPASPFLDPKPGPDYYYTFSRKEFDP